jgi:hypothetical protein
MLQSHRRHATRFNMTALSSTVWAKLLSMHCTNVTLNWLSKHLKLKFICVRENYQAYNICSDLHKRSVWKSILYIKTTKTYVALDLLSLILHILNWSHLA